jgi:hypothetical protein
LPPSPPPFTEHRARIQLSALGDVVSHDAHLNEDGEALLRFLSLHARSAPELWISIRGEHDEQRVETYHDSRDGGRLKTRTSTVTVCDFAFEVPIHTADDPDLHTKLYIVPPELPAWRGRGPFRRSGLTEAAIALPDDDVETAAPPYDRLRGSEMGMKARRRADALWRKFKQRGLPLFAPWAELEHHATQRAPYFDDEGYEHAFTADELESLGDEGYTTIHDGRLVDREAAESGRRAREEAQTRSAVREWCDAFCAEQRPLKEWETTKSFSSWHFARVETGASLSAWPRRG